MLRTNRLLKRQFRELPRNFSLPVSVERADYDATEEIYTYVTKLQRSDIEALIRDYKDQEKQRITAEKAAAEKAAAEKAAAEKAAAGNTASENSNPERLSVITEANQKVDGARRTVDAQQHSNENGRLIVPIHTTNSEIREDGERSNNTFIDESKKIVIEGDRPETAKEAKQRKENENKMADDAVMDLFR